MVRRSVLVLVSLLAGACRSQGGTAPPAQDGALPDGSGNGSGDRPGLDRGGVDVPADSAPWSENVARGDTAAPDRRSAAADTLRPDTRPDTLRPDTLRPDTRPDTLRPDTLFTPYDAPPGTACNVVSQTGCTSTQKCTLVNTGGGTYVPACIPNGTKTEGTACAPSITDPSIDGCIAGTICIGSASGNVCARFCDVSSECTLTASGLCNLRFTGAMPPATLCNYPTPCDPLAQNCSAAGTACYWQPGTPGGYCYPAGGTAVGGACTYLNDCVKGAVCLGTSGGGLTCQLNCRVGGGTPSCPTGTCTSAGTASNPVGVCQ